MQLNPLKPGRWLCPLRTCWRLELNSWCPLPARLLNIWGATALASAASSCGQQFGAGGVGAPQGQDRGTLAWWRLRHVQGRVTRLTACVHPQPCLLQTCRSHQPLTSTVASSPPSVVTASFSYAMGSALSAAGGAPVLPVSSATPTWVAGGEVRWGGRGSLPGSRQEEVAAVQFGRPPAPQTQPAKPSPHTLANWVAKSEAASEGADLKRAAAASTYRWRSSGSAHSTCGAGVVWRVEVCQAPRSNASLALGSGMRGGLRQRLVRSRLEQ